MSCIGFDKACIAGCPSVRHRTPICAGDELSHHGANGFTKLVIAITKLIKLVKKLQLVVCYKFDALGVNFLKTHLSLRILRLFFLNEIALGLFLHFALHDN